MKRALIVILALIAIAVAAITIVQVSSPGLAKGESEKAKGERGKGKGQQRNSIVSPLPSPLDLKQGRDQQRMDCNSRAKAAIIALFSVRPGEMPPELPELTMGERDAIPMIIEHGLTDADGCDAAAARREFRLFMEMGGIHGDFLPAYRRKLMRQVRH